MITNRRPQGEGADAIGGVIFDLGIVLEAHNIWNRVKVESRVQEWPTGLGRYQGWETRFEIYSRLRKDYQSFVRQLFKYLVGSPAPNLQTALEQ